MTTKSAKAAEKSQLSMTKEELERAEKVSAAARRALAEAEARRAGAAQASPNEEIGGRGGLEPTRYGDWEKKGLASDF